MNLLYSLTAIKVNGDIEASIDGDFRDKFSEWALKDICLTLIKNQDVFTKPYENDGFLRILSLLDETNFRGGIKMEDEVRKHLNEITYEEFKNDFITLKRTLTNFPNILYYEFIVSQENALKYCDVILNALNEKTFKEILKVGKDRLEYFYSHIFPRIETTSIIEINCQGFNLDEIKEMLNKFYFSFPEDFRNSVKIDFQNLTCKSIN